MIPFDHVSASQIDNFQDCRRKWWFTSVLGIRPPPSPSAALGTAVHAALENYMLHGTPLPSTDAGRIAAAGLPYTRPGGAAPLVELDMANHPDNRRHLAGVAVHGRIDVFVPSVNPPIVQDWKTTSAFKWSKTESELKYNVQAILYAQFALDYCGKSAQSVRFQHINLLTKGPSTARLVAVDLDRAHVASEYARLDGVVAEMVTTSTATKPSEVAPTESACGKFGGCYFRDRCAALGAFGKPLHENPSHATYMPSQEDSTMSNPAVAAIAALQARKRAAASSTPSSPAPSVTDALPAQAEPSVAASASGAGSAIVPPDAGPETDLTTPPSTWTGEARTLFEERAAIREFDGKQPRGMAEAAAAKEIRANPPTVAAAVAPVHTPSVVDPAPPTPSVLASSAGGSTASPSIEAPPLSAPMTSTGGTTAAPSISRAPLVLYIDCYPMRGIVGSVTHLEDHIAPMQRKIAERAGVPIYSLIEYGKGNAQVAALLLENPPVGAVYVNSRLPASPAALEVLLPLAVGVVRGH